MCSMWLGLVILRKIITLLKKITTKKIISLENMAQFNF